MKPTQPARTPESLTMRPHQMVCLLCHLGTAGSTRRLKNKRLDRFFQVIRKNPRIPLQFVSYGGDRYGGRDAESPCGVLYHMYQDEQVKAKFTAFLGKWERCRTGLGKLFDTGKHVASTEGICWFDPAQPPAWRGCPRAGKGYYERGRKRLRELAAEILPSYNTVKSEAERDCIKAQSAAAVLKSDVIRLFPSHLLFILTAYLQAERREDAPIMHDNLWEPVEAMRRNPRIPVMLVPDHCMVCPPCSGYDLEGSGLCQINPLKLTPGGKSDAMIGSVWLGILRTLGLEYYQKVPAYRLLRRVRERMTPEHIAFTYAGSPPGYFPIERALHDGLGFLEAFEDPRGVWRHVARLLADRRVAELLPEDERDHVRRTLAEAKRCFASGKTQAAYLTLTGSAFAHAWKQYMELIPQGYVRLPAGLKTEARGGDPVRLLKARRAPRAGGPFGARDAVYSSGFVTMPKMNRPAIAETGVRVAYDRDRLYVEFVCAERDTRELKAEARVGTDLKFVGRRYDRRVDDVVVFVVQPAMEEGDVFRFIVNSRGVKLGERCSAREGCRPLEWVRETAWSAVPRVEGSLWTVALTIPFGVLGGAAAKGAVWRMNAHRYFRNSMLDQHSWAVAGWSSDDATGPGRLVFGQART